MTSGSGNGWPDVIKVPAQKVDHDDLCPAALPDPGDTVRQSGCLCHLIAKVRADEQRWKPPLDSLVRANQRLIQQQADLRARVEALPRWEPSPGSGFRFRVWVPLADVLALLDGGN